MNQRQTLDRLQSAYAHLLSPKEAAGDGRFIWINGLAIEVEDLIAALQEEEFTPCLSQPELDAVFNDEADVLEDDSLSLNFHHQDVGHLYPERLQKVRAGKAAKIRKLLKSYVQGNDTNLPRKIHAMLAVQPQLRFSDVAQFLARVAAFDPEAAGAIQASVAEVHSELGHVVQSRAIGRSSSESVRVALAEEFKSFVRLLGLDPREVGEAPAILFERALKGIEMDQEDVMQVVVHDPSVVSVPFSLERARSGAITALVSSPFIALATAFALGPESPHLLSVLGFIVGMPVVSTGTIFLLNHSDSGVLRSMIQQRLLSVSQSTHAKKLENHLKVIREQVQLLRKTPLGRLKLIWAVAHLDFRFDIAPVNVAQKDALLTRIERLEREPSLLKDFTHFCEHRLHDLNYLADAEAIWRDFEAYYRPALRELAE